MTELRTRLGEIPLPSTEIENTTFEHDGGSARVCFTYYRRGEVVVAGIEFSQVRAFRHRAESHCTEWHIDDVYDTLVEIESSEWVAELVGDMSPDMRDLFEMHHYMIYFDSSGCYEVVAAAWRFLPEERHGGGGE